jgi:hypothetical protein
VPCSSNSGSGRRNWPARRRIHSMTGSTPCSEIPISKKKVRELFAPFYKTRGPGYPCVDPRCSISPISRLSRPCVTARARNACASSHDRRRMAVDLVYAGTLSMIDRANASKSRVQRDPGSLHGTAIVLTLCVLHSLRGTRQCWMAWN